MTVNRKPLHNSAKRDRLKTVDCQSGITLILSILLMSLILFLGIYFLSFSIIEDRISRSHSKTLQSYYLAEAGLHEMIYKLKNDEDYKTNFEENPSWTETFLRNNPFGNGQHYEVIIQNTSEAHGEISATGIINLSEETAVQRVAETKVFKALGQTPVADSAGYADGNIDISASLVNFYNGSAFSNNNFTINIWSTINIDNDLKAVGNFNKSWTSEANVNGDIYAHNYDPPGPPEEILMPAIDFESAATTSYKNIADVVYTESEFEDLMEANQNLTLNDPITYVEKDVKLQGGQNLIINGLLVVERDIKIGYRNCWKWRCGPSSVVVNYLPGSASGILAKRKIEFQSWTGNVDINGLVYANDELSIFSFTSDFNINGGLIGRKLSMTSIWQPINIYHDNNILIDVLGATKYSPIINIEHWEEEY